MRTCIFNPLMGVSGDMLVGALIDCGADAERVRSAMEEAGTVLAKTEVSVSMVEKCGLRATSVTVRTEQVTHRHASDMKKALEEALARTGVRNVEFARGCLEALLSAESHVHGVPQGDLMLHETGSADTLADIVGATAACEQLDLFGCNILTTAIITGHGFVKTHHGTMPIPAPATAELLRGFVIEAGQVEGELTTPTGAALLTRLVSYQVPSMPPIRLERTGYGAGVKDFAFPNVFRVMVGESDTRREEIVVLETNLDDVSGEVLGHAVAGLQCLDFAIVPSTTKKNRPGYILQVVCEKGKEGEVAEYIFRKTGSLGIRVRSVDRFVLEREISSVEVAGEEVRFKTSRLGGTIVRKKPEFADIERLAQKKGISLFEAERMAVKEDEERKSD